MSAPHRLYLTQVMHRRLFPVRYRFVYRVFSLLLDLDALDTLGHSGSRWLSIGRFNLLSFHPADHGPRDGSPLRPWLDRLLGDHGIDLAGGPVKLLCFPRVLGVGFNPLSLWYCFHPDGGLRVVLAEVNNTFGEHHFYLLGRDRAPGDQPLRDAANKCFHVSPLIGMDAQYRFRLAVPDERLSVLIREYQDGRLMLVASQTGQGVPLNDRTLLRAWLRTPLATLKVVAAIHWQALKIWLRGAPFFPKPSPPRNEVT